MMATYDDILNNIDKEAYNREADKIMALVRAGHKITIVKPTAGTPKSIQSDKKLIKTANRMVSNLPEPIIESSSIPEPDIPAPLYKEVDADINLEPEAKELLSCMAEAQLYAQFCETVLERLEDSEARLETWNLIAEEYNSGKLVPELFKMRGKRTERSLRKWIDLYLETNRNMFSLIHKSRSQNKGRKVTYLEQHFLLKLLLTPQKVKIYTAVTTIKAYARMGALESPSSVPTLVRWCDDWVSNNKAVWTQARLGSKAVAEDIVKTIHRDNSLLNVGDVWVADGHTLAFDIINPKTGKAQRMTMIMVMDWASRYPVGASLAFTEDSQHIQLAFRNGFLNWGALPKYVYLDNGKAFRSKLFNEKWQEHDLSSDLAGIFPRLGIQVAFAESYNAKAKIIERFFKTFQEQFERFIGTFRGASIADKPATLMRNEKWARKMYEATPNYIQVKNNQKKDFAYADIIHIKKSTHKSNAWGLACLPIAINVEILSEIKTFDYNNFKNGLMIDYFVIVEGGTLRDGTVTDEQGNEVLTDAYTEIEKALTEVKGNAKSHSTVLIESESRDVKIRLEPLRQQDREGGFINLKKDLREGIFAYHRVPARIVSQLIPGQLGGDNKSDMLMFYHFVVKPLQNRLALTLAIEFNYEFGWNLTPDDFNFGNLTEKLQSADDQLFMQNRSFGAQ
jgi:hypothetical protein